jgi:hypothetical protein
MKQRNGPSRSCLKGANGNLLTTGKNQPPPDLRYFSQHANKIRWQIQYALHGLALGLGVRGRVRIREMRQWPSAGE